MRPVEKKKHRKYKIKKTSQPYLVRPEGLSFLLSFQGPDCSCFSQ